MIKQNVNFEKTGQKEKQRQNLLGFNKYRNRDYLLKCVHKLNR